MLTVYCSPTVSELYEVTANVNLTFLLLLLHIKNMGWFLLYQAVVRENAMHL